MKLVKKLSWFVMLLALLLVLTGCSQNQQAIFDAAMKMQNVTSLQQQTTMTFKLSGSGFDPAVQQQVDTAAEFMNNAKLNLNVKTSSNQERTLSKAQVDMDLALPGMNITLPVWVDADLTGEEPKLIEIIKLPQIAKASLPPEFAGKEYTVMNPYNMGGPQPNYDLSKLAEFSKSMPAKQLAFLTSFAQRFNPDLKVISKGSQYLQTNEGSKLAKLYEIKLNDSQLKDFIRYAVNNFAQDQEAMTFIKEYMDTIMGFSQVPGKANTLNEFDQAFEDFGDNKQEFLTGFNKVMDELENVTLLGDQGLELQYAIVDGYVVKKSGTLDLNVDLPQIIQLMQSLTPGPQQTMSEDTAGNLSLKVNFSTVTSDINQPFEIQIPEVNENNSFDYMDLMKAFNPLADRPVRLAGQDGYETAKIIGEEYNSGQCTSIILASGLNFSDALSSSILSQKFDAPILLVGASVEESSAAFDYIASHSNSDTKLFIVGGTGVIGTPFETELIKRGHVNIERLGGSDSYETGIIVAEKADAAYGTPVFLISGESFPDALSAAGFAGAYQYPALLIGKNELTDKTKNYIASNNPTTVYIVGGEAAISQSVEAQIKELVPAASIKRLAGNDSFATAGAVLDEFAEFPLAVYLANGSAYQDALAGSSLAARTADPVLLVDPNRETLPPAIEAYLKKLRDTGSRPMVRALGGAVVVPDSLIKQAEALLDGK
ncbi:cell wall-binding repeat-containing protein [Desulfosporosinus youngiae]|uniref:Cell wall-binding protein n=1 Tax=Desulfosporosinus youngiae DSM 17734 TaxID=768710 RepID=H5XZ45_9FIRM|nr:cell wall-binding repeat-containing protein [Desulfosporosinus youngiae]EHQ91751.1 cell wall-binding protein [Desulfosporosinus youngiae DSM 17734]